MKTRKIVISGPESTGKTELCKALSSHYKGIWIPEYARQYIEKLDKPYTREDVVLIARTQKQQFSEDYSDSQWVFFDTGMIITKVWMEVVFEESPSWLDQTLRENIPDLVLLCYPDIEWKPDPVRENGGRKRLVLYKKYLQNLKDYEYPHHIVLGEDEARIDNAIMAINNKFSLK